MRVSECVSNKPKKKIKEKSREKFDLLLFSILFFCLFFFVHLSNLFQRKQPNFLINLSNLIDILKESVDLKEKGKKKHKKKKTTIKD